jgi:SAM-dependent methyltransferase
MQKVNVYQNTAWLYDYDMRDNLKDDIPFYIGYAAKTGNKVLELGCGTGRVALELAKTGAKVTGLELSDTMIEMFHQKLEKADDNIKDKITIVKSNMANFSLNKKFDLVIAPFRAFQALTDDIDIKSSLKCIREHLTEEGLFIVNVFRPYKQLDQSWCYPETVQWETVDESTGCKIAKKTWGDKIDMENQVIYPHYAFEIIHSDGSFERIEDDLKLKYYYYHQLKSYIINAGLTIVEEYGWYDKSDIENGRELIFVCGKKN